MSPTPKPPPFADENWRQRSPSHHKPALPSMEDLAAMLRAGELLEDLADTFDRHPGTLQGRLTAAGYSSLTGEPLQKSEPTPDPFAKAFKYEAWMDDSLCAQTDPEAFFPDKGGSTREAKSTCARCTVAAECLDYALANQERFGIWGGLSERERRKLTHLLDFPNHPEADDVDLDTTQEIA